MSKPKIDMSSLQQTNLGFPALFEAKTEDEQLILMHYRYGDLTVYLCEDDDSRKAASKKLIDKDESATDGVSVLMKEQKDEFSLGGVIQPEEILVVLLRNELVENDE